jgi:hypothetical protein
MNMGLPSFGSVSAKRTYRQRQASRRNLSRARARRHRRSGRGRRGLHGDLGLIIGLVAVALGLIAAAAAVRFGDAHPVFTVALVLVVVALIVCGFAWRVTKRRAKVRRIESERVANAQELGRLLVVTPTEFEHTIAALLRASGYTDVVVSGRSGDLAADITCRDGAGAVVIVQCKQYAPSRRVGTPEVQTFIGMAFAHHGASRTIYVTTADYTKGAKELAALHHIELWDGKAIVDLARRTGTASG